MYYYYLLLKIGFATSPSYCLGKMMPPSIRERITFMKTIIRLDVDLNL